VVDFQEHEIIGGEPDRNIEEIFAVIAIGPKGEGIMAYETMIAGKRGFLPLVGSNRERVKQMVKIAKSIGHDFKVCRFTNKEDVTDQFVE
jgi:hypothetical protein